MASEITDETSLLAAFKQLKPKKSKKFDKWCKILDEEYIYEVVGRRSFQRNEDAGYVEEHQQVVARSSAPSRTDST